jgi:hypothetical protein
MTEEEEVRDMAKKTAVGDWLTVEFSSEPPALAPGAARAVLRMLLEAREKQAKEEPGTRPNQGAPSLRMPSTS